MVIESEELINSFLKTASDPRETGLKVRDLPRFYNFKYLGNGEYSIYRSDKKKFKDYDKNNVQSLISNLDTFDEDAQFYIYNAFIDDFDLKKNKHTIIPEKLDFEHVLNNINKFYIIKYKTTKDKKIPILISKKDKSKFTTDDEYVLKKWIKDKFKDIELIDVLNNNKLSLNKEITVTES